MVIEFSLCLGDLMADSRRAIENDFRGFSFDELFTSQLIKNISIGQKAPTLYPSSASIVLNLDSIPGGKVIGGCNRGEFYRIKGLKATNPPGKSTMMAAAMGNAIEDIVRAQVLKDGTFVEAQTPIYINDLKVSGRLDLLCERNGYIYIVEVKSFAKYWAHKEICGYYEGTGENRKFYLPNPKMNHLFQVALYTYVLRDKAIGAKLYYVARDDAATQEFNVICVPCQEDGKTVHRIELSASNREPAILKSFTIEGILERFRLLSDAVESDTLPEREYYLKYPIELIEPLHKHGYIKKTDYSKWKKSKNKKKHELGDWECSYCNYKDLCWGK